MAWVWGPEPGRWTRLAEAGRPLAHGPGPVCLPPGHLVHALPALTAEGRTEATLR